MVYVIFIFFYFVSIKIIDFWPYKFYEFTTTNGLQISNFRFFACNGCKIWHLLKKLWLVSRIQRSDARCDCLRNFPTDLGSLIFSITYLTNPVKRSRVQRVSTQPLQTPGYGNTINMWRQGNLTNYRKKGKAQYP